MDPNQTFISGAGNRPGITGISNGIDLNSPIWKDPMPLETENNEPENEVSNYFTVKIYKNLKISIYKPLLPLKLALFLYYGGEAGFSTFLLVFLKQRGITLSELATIYVLSPVCQFLGPALSGIIADKIGRSKPVLVVNLLLAVTSVLGLLLAPSLNVNCNPQPIYLKCRPQEFGRLTTKTTCDVSMDVIGLSSCNVTCPQNVTQYCNGQNLKCGFLDGNKNFKNISLSVQVNWAYKLKSMCYYNVTAMSPKNIIYSRCNVPHTMYCRISCLTNPDEDCSDDISGRTKILILYMILLISFATSNSNCNSIFDVTTMCLVKDHNSDFGRERIFGISAVLIFTPVIGYVIDRTTDVTNKDYSIAFFFFIGTTFLHLIVIHKLKVRVKAPGTNMWRKSLRLLKNPDVIAFILVLSVLGTAWGFTKYYSTWYLEGMKAPSFLFGLISAINSLYGLPFLFTSNWWVKKIGTTQIFILGLLAHATNAVGYSLLYDPWLALLLEATHILTYHLLWVAVIAHSHAIAPEGLTATIISTAGGIHYSLGIGSGGFIGGIIVNAFGGRVSYRIIAVMSSTYAVLYAVYLYTRKMHFGRSNTLDIRNEPESITYDNEDDSEEIFLMKSKS